MSENIGSPGGDRDMLDDLCDQQLETAEILHKTRMTLKAVMKTVNVLQSKVITLEAAMIAMEERDEVVPESPPRKAGSFCDSIEISGEHFVWDEARQLFTEK